MVAPDPRAIPKRRVFTTYLQKELGKVTL